jgi:hypothetical protein
MRCAIKLHTISYPHLLVSGTSWMTYKCIMTPDSTAIDTLLIHRTLYVDFGGITGGGGTGLGGGDPCFAADLGVVP